jgi:ABC-type uncharacterized transport system ATPase subunit
MLTFIPVRQCLHGPHLTLLSHRPHRPLQGLDPASRRNLWDVVRSSKKGRGIVLTTHSMEEAEILCDRLGIFVDGQLVCIGNPKEITSRYGDYYVSHSTPTGRRLSSGQMSSLLQMCDARPSSLQMFLPDPNAGRTCHCFPRTRSPRSK